MYNFVNPNFRFFPDGFTTKELVFQWKEENAVQLSENISLPEFIINRSLTRFGDCTIPYITGIEREHAVNF